MGDDCAIADRIAVDSLGVAGIHVEEALGFVNLADHLVDLWDVNVGSIAEWSKDSGTSRYFEEGYQLEWTGGVGRPPPSRSSASAGSRAPTGWRRSSGAAPGT